MVDGKLGEFTKVDDQTFKIKFAGPYGLFLQRLASVYGVQIDMMAKHYCSQFMPQYNKTNLDDLIKQAGRQELVRALHQEMRRRHRGQ